MPRIFLPATTAENNALLAGNSEEQSAAFAFQESDDERTTDDETLDNPSPSSRRPPERHRQQQQQQQECIGGVQENRSSSGSGRGISKGGIKRGRMELEADGQNKRPAPAKLAGTHDATMSGGSEGDNHSPPVVEHNSADKATDFHDADRSAEQAPPRPRPTIGPAAPSSSGTITDGSSAGSAPRGSTRWTNAPETFRTGQGSRIAGNPSPTRRREPAGARDKQGEETYAVVFMTQSLGITLAAPDDGGGSLVVCDKETTTATQTSNPSSRICIGDRLVSVGGTSAIGLGVNRVERLTVRGSRPLEMVFRRRRRSSFRAGVAPGPSAASPTVPVAAAAKMTAAMPSTGTGSTHGRGKHRPPPGGLEQPARDCLLDIISGIATQQEDALLAESQPEQSLYQRETARGLAVSVAGGGGNRSKRGERALPETAAPAERVRPPSWSFTPPRRPSGGSGCGGAVELATKPREDCDIYEDNDDDNNAGDRRQSQGAASDAAETSPSFSSASSSTEEEVTSPDIGGPPGRLDVDVGTPAPQAEPTARGCEGQAAAVARAAVPTHTRMAAEQHPPMLRGGARAAHEGGGGVGNGVPTPREPNPSQRPDTSHKRNNGAAGATSAPRQQTIWAGPGSKHTPHVDNHVGRAGSPSPLPSAAPPGLSGGSSNGKRPAPRPVSAAAQAPTPAEVAGILAKLGPKGVSELGLYKNLTFDELVRLCRYTGRVDLSKRLPKATMAECLNSLCVEQGALASELQNSGAAAAVTAGGEGRVRERAAERSGGGPRGGRRGAPAGGRGELGEIQGSVSARGGVGKVAGPVRGGTRSDCGDRGKRVDSSAAAAAANPALRRARGPAASDAALPQTPALLALSAVPTPSPHGDPGDQQVLSPHPTSSSWPVQETDRDTPRAARAVGPPQSTTSLSRGGCFASPVPQQQRQQQQLQCQQLQGGTPSTPRQVSGRRYDGEGGGEDDDGRCWADWEFPEKSTRGGGGGGGGGVRLGGRGGGTSGGRDGAGSPGALLCSGKSGGGNNNSNNNEEDDNGYHGGVDDEAAWWSREPDYRDWSPCSSPTSAAVPPPSKVLSWSKSSPASLRSSFGYGRGGDGDAGAVDSRLFRRNPLLPPGASSSSTTAGVGASFAGTSATASSERQRQQAGRNPLSFLSGRFPGGGLGFTALPKWVLRSVRTIGTQTTRR